MLTLNVEDLIVSAMRIGAHCDGLAAAHLTSDNRIEAARSGWADSSGRALGAKLASWQWDSNVLLAKLADHVRGLQAAAGLFTTSEAQRAERLSAGVETNRC